MGRSQSGHPRFLPGQRTARAHEAADLLAVVDLFRGLKPGEFARFLAGAELRTYAVGAVIYSPEDPSTEQLFILRTGSVERYRLTPGGKRLVTRRITPGEVFGVMGLLGRTMQGNFAEASEDSSVYVLTRESVLALLKRQPELALRLLENMGNRVRQLEERLVGVAYSPVKARLARFLLDNTDPRSGLVRSATHEQIANSIGAVRQTVTETLAVMKRHGLVESRARQIRVVDRPGLEKIAAD